MRTLLPRIAGDPDVAGASPLASIDHLEWAAGAVFEGFGVRIGVRVDDPALLDGLREFLPPGFAPADGDIVDHLYSVCTEQDGTGADDRRFVVYAGATEWARLPGVHQACEAFDSAVRLDVAVATARRLVFVHAGVVGWRGRALIVPGRSGFGKSTLVDALVRAGATYYSDEAAVIDANGHVHPFARPIALLGEHGPRRIDVAAEGFRVGTKPLPVGWVVSTRYTAGEDWHVRAQTPAAALLVLFENTVGARVAPVHTLRTLGRAVQKVPLLEGRRGEAVTAAEHLLRHLDLERDATNETRSLSCTERSPSPRETDAVC